MAAGDLFPAAVAEVVAAVVGRAVAVLSEAVAPQGAGDMTAPRTPSLGQRLWRHFVTDRAQVERTFPPEALGRIERTIGEIEVLVFNIGANGNDQGSNRLVELTGLRGLAWTAFVMFSLLDATQGYGFPTSISYGLKISSTMGNLYASQCRRQTNLFSCLLIPKYGQYWQNTTVCLHAS